MCNIENQLGKCDFCYGSIVNNLKDRKFFSNYMNRNCFDPLTQLLLGATGTVLPLRI